MKTFNKIALVSAIAVAPFTQAMEALDDSVLGNTTGQAGVTVEINIGTEGVSIGSVTYTDTEVTGGKATNGSVVLENITIKDLTDLKQTIDVNVDGDLVMTTTEALDVKLGLGVDLTDATTIAATNGKSALMLQSANGVAQAELINDLSMQLDLGASTTTIHNLSGGTGTGTLADAGVAGSHSTDTASLAIQMDSEIRIDDLDVGLFGYTATQANGLAQGHATTTAAKTTLGTAAAGTVTYDANTGVASSDDSADDAVVATFNTTLAGVKATIASGSAIQATNITFNDGTGGYASIDQTIWAKGGAAADGGGVYIQVGQIAGTLTVGDISIGQASIGSLEIKDLNLAGMTQRIYGH